MTSTGILAVLAILATSASAQLVSRFEFNNAALYNSYPAPESRIYDAFIAELHRSGITRKEEAAMAITQFMHESDGFRAVREYRCDGNNCPNEYRTPGCDQPGQYYYGRGFIQLTWCYNYRDASNELYGNDWLISDADAAARDFNVAWQTSMWFWRSRVHNAAGVQDLRFGATTRAINGYLECDLSSGHAIARKRFDMYRQVRNALGFGYNGDERGCYN